MQFNSVIDKTFGFILSYYYVYHPPAPAPPRRTISVMIRIYLA